MMKRTLTDPPEVVRVGINDASVFKGFCSEHDSRLFASAETKNQSRKNAMFISLHMRALSLEYCRKRRNVDFFRKAADLTPDSPMRAKLQEGAEQYSTFCSLFEKLYLGSIFNLIRGSDVDSVEYWCVPFSRNLQVSCCGCFNEKRDAFDSVIAFNMVSYADMSILALTIFKAVERYLDSFLAGYKFPRDTEALVNDIAFARCEEPLISPQLWESLSEDEKVKVRLSLRHPDLRTGEPTPRIIRITSSDMVKEITPAMMTRLSPVASRAISLILPA